MFLIDTGWNGRTENERLAGGALLGSSGTKHGNRLVGMTGVRVVSGAARIFTTGTPAQQQSYYRHSNHQELLRHHVLLALIRFITRHPDSGAIV